MRCDSLAWYQDRRASSLVVSAESAARSVDRARLPWLESPHAEVPAGSQQPQASLADPMVVVEDFENLEDSNDRFVPPPALSFSISLQGEEWKPETGLLMGCFPKDLCWPLFSCHGREHV